MADGKRRNVEHWSIGCANDKLVDPDGIAVEW